MSNTIKLTNEQAADIRNGKVVYVPRRKWNEDDGSWWLIAAVDSDGFHYLPVKYGSKCEAMDALALLNKLLKQSIDQHGYWLWNHREIIAGDLLEALAVHGLPSTAATLSDRDSALKTTVYAKIGAARSEMTF